MIGLDTNVVVRFLAQDDDAQSPVATRFMARLSRERPGFISAVVLTEITWVLSRAYKASRDDIAAAVEGLLRAAELVVEHADAGYRALGLYRAARAVEFGDAFIAEIAALAGATETVTFDRGAAAESGMRLLA
ncbi:MAG: PIN domain-containing protein [Hyphomonadaceae bacterium]